MLWHIPCTDHACTYHAHTNSSGSNQCSRTYIRTSCSHKYCCNDVPGRSHWNQFTLLSDQKDRRSYWQIPVQKKMLRRLRNPPGFSHIELLEHPVTHRLFHALDHKRSNLQYRNRTKNNMLHVPKVGSALDGGLQQSQTHQVSSVYQPWQKTTSDF